MLPQTPYTHDLGEREPIRAMADATERIREIVSGWTPAQFERTYAPGKWTARELLIHLVQIEIAFGNRARMALATPNYASQAFSQDAWMAVESKTGGREAAEAFVAMNAMNRAFFSGLSPTERATPFTHPEYGALTLDWLIHHMAGHVVHHLAHFEIIATSG